MTMSRKAWYSLCIIFVLFLFLLIFFLWVQNDMSDFGVCYKAGQRISKGETLYRTSDGHLQYKYSPASAIFFSVFSLVSYKTAQLLWYVAELTFLLLILFLSYNLLPSNQKKKGVIVSFSFLVLLRFFAREIELGQVNLLILFLLIFMLKAMLKRADIGAGLCWGLSLFFKPYALVFLPYFILKKRARLIATGLGVGILGFFLPSLFYGFKQNFVILEEWRKTLSQSTRSLLRSYDNASVHGFFLKILPEERGDLGLILIILIFLLVGFAFLYMMHIAQKKDLVNAEILESSFLFLLIPFFSPLGWYYNYLYSLLAVALLLNFIDKFPNILRYGLILNFISIGIALREILGKDVYYFYTQYALVVINYLIILYFLFHSRIKSYS